MILKSFVYFSILVIFITVFKQKTIGQNIVQSITELHPLKVGDRCPDFTIDNIINYKNQTVKLSDFRGKWLILDFWFIQCQPCLKMLPKTDSLQRVFDGEIQFMPVTFNKKEDVKKLFARMNEGEGVNYPCATDASKTDLYKLFEHSYSPHYVWIDGEGVIRAITGHEQVNYENIQGFIEGKKMNLPIKDDHEAMSSGPQTTENVTKVPSTYKKLYESVLTGYQPGRPSVFRLSNTDSIYAYNVTIGNLFRIAYANSNETEFPFSLTIWELKDSSRYFVPKDGSKIDLETWKKYSYCYQLNLPERFRYKYKSGEKYPDASKNSSEYQIKKKQVCQIMQQDLGRYFNIMASKEKRKMKCIILKASDTTRLSSTSSVYKMQYDKAYFLKMVDGTIDQFLAPFRNIYFWKIPVINESVYKGRCDIEISATMDNVEKVNESLKKYGLYFIEDEREIEVLVLKEVNN